MKMIFLILFWALLNEIQNIEIYGEMGSNKGL